MIGGGKLVDLCFSNLKASLEFSALNAVSNLKAEAQTSSSITLSWEAPDDTDPENLTYWVQCRRDDNIHTTINTTDTNLTVDGLAPASSYEFSVWAEKDGTNSTLKTINASTGERQTLCILSSFEGTV